RKTTAGFGAGNPKNKRVIGTIHIGRHGVAFLVDKTLIKDMKKVMFDPPQSRSNNTAIQKSVRLVIEGVVVLEMLLCNSSWDDCMYGLLPYLRLRCLHKAL
ncbi:hypothetical protein PHYSODRAFT_405757, partial [Phytophthora sojae]